MKKCFAIIGPLLIAGFSVADEPPQCNLPGWQVVKADLCKCGVACPCADMEKVASIVTKPAVAKSAKTATVKQALPVQTRREYFYQGRQLMYRDVAAVTTPQTDCSSGTCRYVR